MEKLSLCSPAKVNLGLKVIAKRSDGYHEIQTVFQMVDLCDDLTFEKTPVGIEVISDRTALPADQDNLVYRAARLLASRTRTDWGAGITLTKRIPLAAGLGGGSSNAASTLLGLNHLWKLGMSRRGLMELAQELGSDVPFFLFAPRAYGSGRGEKLETLPLGQKTTVILLTPSLPISTAWAYANLKPYLGNDQGEIDRLQHLIEIGQEEEIGPHLYNTFEFLLSSLHPLIPQLKRELLRWGAYGALMSGSGPTVFGLFRSRSKAEAVYQVMKNQGLKSDKPGWDAFLAETVTDLKGVYGVDPLL